MTQEIDIETIIGVEIEVDRSRDRRDSRKNSRDRGRSNSRESRNNIDLVQVKDILIERISVTTAIEQVIQHIGVSNLKTI